MMYKQLFINESACPCIVAHLNTSALSVTALLLTCAPMRKVDTSSGAAQAMVPICKSWARLSP